MQEKIDYFRFAELTEDTIRAFTEDLPKESQPTTYKDMKNDKLDCLVFFFNLSNKTIREARHITMVYPKPLPESGPYEQKHYFGTIIRIPTERAILGTEWFPGSKTNRNVGGIEFVRQDKTLGTAWNAFFVIQCPNTENLWFYIAADYKDNLTTITIRFSEEPNDRTTAN